MRIIVFMETETIERVDAALCACVNVPEHEALCPKNPDPWLCEDCEAPFDPLEVDRPEWCHMAHCRDCAETCGACCRPMGQHSGSAGWWF